MDFRRSERIPNPTMSLLVAAEEGILELLRELRRPMPDPDIIVDELLGPTDSVSGVSMGSTWAMHRENLASQMPVSQCG